jgi:hypothetical protein
MEELGGDFSHGATESTEQNAEPSDLALPNFLVLVLSAAVLVLVLEWTLPKVRLGPPVAVRSVWAALRALCGSVRKTCPVLPGDNPSQRRPLGLASAGLAGIRRICRLDRARRS